MGTGSVTARNQTALRWQRLPVPVRRAAVRARRLSHLSRRPQPHVTVHVADGVALVRFDDGKVNVISRESAALLAQACDHVASDEGVRAAVLVGRPGQFSAGFDLDTLVIGGADRTDLFRGGWAMLMRYFTLPIPLVVACTGHAVAAGAVLLLAGDRRLVAAGDFRIGFNEASIGLPLPRLLLMLARDRLAPDAFDEATAGARMYRPDEACSAGFADRVVPAGDLLQAAVDEARRLAGLPPSEFVDPKRNRIAERTAVVDSNLAADLEMMRKLGG